MERNVPYLCSEFLLCCKKEEENLCTYFAQVSGLATKWAHAEYDSGGLN